MDSLESTHRAACLALEQGQAIGQVRAACLAYARAAEAAGLSQTAVHWRRLAASFATLTPGPKRTPQAAPPVTPRTV